MKLCAVVDILPGLPTPEYKLPFEAEVGAHPSFEEMQVAVSRNKLRPAFPDLWKDTNMVCLLLHCSDDRFSLSATNSVSR